MGSDNIKTKTISNMAWKFSERILAQFVSLIVSIIIARILSPKDYSVVGLVTIFFSFANVFISSGLNTALIQKKDADVLDYSTIFFFSIILSIVVYFILFFLAPVIAKIYELDILIIMIRIMGLTLPICAVKSIYCAYVSSSLQFKKFFFSTLGGTIFSAFVGIYMSLNGYGAWSLIAQQITNTLIDTIILVFTTKMPLVLKISIQKFGILFKYGWKIFISSIINTLYSEINPLIIGVKFNDEDLSFYKKGFMFPNTLASTVNYTVSAVLFPVLSKYQDDKITILKFTRIFIRVSSYIIFPLMIGFIAVADNFILVVLTEKWMPAAIYIKVFSIACMFDMICTGNCETIKAIGRSDIFLIIEIIKKMLYFIIIFIFVKFSSSPVVLSFSTIVCTIVAVLINSIPNIKLIGYKPLQQVADIFTNMIISLVMGTCVYLMNYIQINPVLLLILQVLSGVLIYIFISVITKNQSLKYLISTIKKFKKGDGENG